MSCHARRRRARNRRTVERWERRLKIWALALRRLRPLPPGVVYSDTDSTFFQRPASAGELFLEKQALVAAHPKIGGVGWKLESALPAYPGVICYFLHKSEKIVKVHFVSSSGDVFTAFDRITNESLDELGAALSKYVRSSS